MKFQTAIIKALDASSVTRSKGTTTTYATALRSFSKFLAETRRFGKTTALDRLRVEDFVGYPTWLASENKSSSTRNTYIAGVKFFMDWLILNNHLKVSHAQILHYRQAVEFSRRKRIKRVPKGVSQADIQKMITAARKSKSVPHVKKRNLAILLLLQTSGCRVEELCDLTMAQLNLQKKNALIIGKGDKEEFIFFTDKAKRALTAYLKTREIPLLDEAPVFIRYDKQASNKALPLSTKSVREIINILAEAAGLNPLDVSPHKFRHAFAIQSIKMHGLAMTQDLMRHSNPNTTRVYATFDDSQKKAAHGEIFDD